MAGKAAPSGVGVQGVVAGFSLSVADIRGATDHCLHYISEALEENGGTQIPSFVTNIPNGSETGVFLAVDLGGTHCRISAVELHGNSTYSMKQSKHTVPRSLTTNQRHEPLFDFIAKSLATFLLENPELNAKKNTSTTPASEDARKLGFTFSFTYASHSVNHGTMLQWDKGWDIPDAIGKDPCSMLQEAIDRQKLHVRVTALTNDSVGTLMAKAYTSSQAGSPLIGAIFGTGTNAAYAEDMTRIRKLLQPNTGMNSQDSVMVINTEWGAWFDQAPSALPGCVYDSVLDQESSSPGKQLFEKRTSGLYLGELLRLAMLDLISSRQLQIPAKPGSMLKRPYSIDAALISMLATSFDDPKATKWQTVAEKISATLDVDEVNNNDVQALLLLGAAIMKRAAQLAGATMAAIVIQSGRLAPLVPMLKPIATSKWKRWCKWLRFGGAVCLFGRRQVDDDAATLDSDKTLDAAAGCIEIGIDGSLFEHYPRFEEEIRRALRALPGIGPEGEARVKIGLTKDGSSLGAALIAQSVP